MLKLEGIKNIIFDFGGVILKLDYKLTEKKFSELGLENIDEVYSQFNQTNLFDDLETGAISGEYFIQEVSSVMHKGVKSDQVVAAWNSMLLNLPGERLEVLRVLTKEFNMVLLSNTNAIHYDCFKANLMEEHSLADFSEFFENEYYSHLIGMRKPNIEVFEWVLNQKKWKAAETLFIDDSPQHIEGAQKAGLHTHHLKVDQESIVTLFSNFLTKLHQ